MNLIHFSLSGLRTISFRMALLEEGTLIHVPPGSPGRPAVLRGGPFRSAAASRDGIGAVTAAGVAITACCHRVKFMAPPSVGRNWCSVEALTYGFAWTDDTGTVAISRGASSYSEIRPPAGHRFDAIALGLPCCGGLVRLDDARIQPMSDYDPRAGNAAFAESLVRKHPKALAVAASPNFLGIVDLDGRPHFAGLDAHLLVDFVPPALPPLRSLALAFGPRVAGLDLEGRIHWFGEGRVGRHLLPDEMLGTGFVRVWVGQHWICAMDGDGVGHAFGHVPGWRDHVDPMARLLLRARLARRAGACS